MRLAGKVAIVTGAGSGFGEGIARRFAQEGAQLLCNDINAAAGERVTSEIAAAGGSAAFLAGNVAVDADVAALVAVERRPRTAGSTSSSTTPGRRTAIDPCSK